MNDIDFHTKSTAQLLTRLRFTPLDMARRNQSFAQIKIDEYRIQKTKEELVRRGYQLLKSCWAAHEHTLRTGDIVTLRQHEQLTISASHITISGKRKPFRALGGMLAGDRMRILSVDRSVAKCVFVYILNGVVHPEATARIALAKLEHIKDTL